jgi:hypothetical protein
MAAADSFEMSSTVCMFTLCFNVEDHCLNFHHHENPRSHNYKLITFYGLVLVVWSGSGLFL